MSCIAYRLTSVKSDGVTIRFLANIKKKQTGIYSSHISLTANNHLLRRAVPANRQMAERKSDVDRRHLMVNHTDRVFN